MIITDKPTTIAQQGFYDRVAQTNASDLPFEACTSPVVALYQRICFLLRPDFEIDCEGKQSRPRMSSKQREELLSAFGINPHAEIESSPLSIGAYRAYISEQLHISNNNHGSNKRALLCIHSLLKGHDIENPVDKDFVRDMAGRIPKKADRKFLKKSIEYAIEHTANRRASMFREIVNLISDRLSMQSVSEPHVKFDYMEPFQIVRMMANPACFGINLNATEISGHLREETRDLRRGLINAIPTFYAISIYGEKMQHFGAESKISLELGSSFEYIDIVDVGTHRPEYHVSVRAKNSVATRHFSVRKAFDGVEVTEVDALSD